MVYTEPCLAVSLIDNRFCMYEVLIYIYVGLVARIICGGNDELVWVLDFSIHFFTFIQLIVLISRS